MYVNKLCLKNNYKFINLKKKNIKNKCKYIIYNRYNKTLRRNFNVNIFLIFKSTKWQYLIK